MKLVDATVTKNGFVRNKNPIAAEDQARGLIASYGICRVLLQSNRLDVAFVEVNTRHLGPRATKAIEQLKDILTRQYGKQNVRVEH